MATRTWRVWPSVPRLLAAFYALFIALFALDAFAAGAADFWTKLGAFAIHLIPAAFLIGVLLIAWRNELVGGIIYLTLGLAYVIATGGLMATSAYAVITGALVLIGLLFLASWWFQGHPRKAA